MTYVFIHTRAKIHESLAEASGRAMPSSPLGQTDGRRLLPHSGDPHVRIVPSHLLTFVSSPADVSLPELTTGEALKMFLLLCESPEVFFALYISSLILILLILIFHLNKGDVSGCEVVTLLWLPAMRYL